MKRLMAAWTSTSDRNTPRRSRRFASLAKKPSTALSQEAEVGVKWKVKPRVPVEPGVDLRVLVDGVVVQDRVDDLSGRDRRLNRVEKADELLMPVALHAAADHLALRDIHRDCQEFCVGGGLNIRPPWPG